MKQINVQQFGVARAAVMLLCSTMVLLEAYGDLKRMTGTASGSTSTSTTLQTAMTWNAEDPNETTITPWQTGSNECVYAIQSSSAIRKASAFPDVPVLLENTGAEIELKTGFSSDSTSVTFPQVKVCNGSKGFKLNDSGKIFTAYMNGS